jgi:hypothetical protein
VNVGLIHHRARLSSLAFLKPVAVSTAAPSAHRHCVGALQSGLPKMALYPLTGCANLHLTLNQHKLANYGQTGSNPLG